MLNNFYTTKGNCLWNWHCFCIFNILKKIKMCRSRLTSSYTSGSKNPFFDRFADGDVRRLEPRPSWRVRQHRPLGHSNLSGRLRRRQRLPPRKEQPFFCIRKKLKRFFILKSKKVYIVPAAYWLADNIINQLLIKIRYWPVHKVIQESGYHYTTIDDKVD